MKKEVTSTVKKTAKKEKSEKTVSTAAVSPVVVPAAKPALKPAMSNGAKIGLGVAAGLAVLAGVLYNRFWNIATVNGHPISRLSYYQTIEKQAGKQALDNMIMESLILNEAAKNKVTVPQADIDKQLNQIESQMKAQGTTLDEALKKEGMTKADLIRQIQLQQLVQIMGKNNTEITDDQINKYLTDNKATLPKDAKPDELKQLAKDALTQQNESSGIQAWLAKLRSSATINYY